jgi:hypothetical protein
MDTFCELEKDEKTFNILVKYLDDIKNGVDLDSEDGRIQVDEITKHNYLNGKNDSLNWIDKHGIGERRYLNTIKQLAVIYYCTGSKLTWKNFCRFIDRLNNIKKPVLEKIHLLIMKNNL